MNSAPIVELAMTFQFQELPRFTARDLVDLQQRLGRFPVMQHAPKIAPMGRMAGGPIITVGSDELPRTWFLTQDLSTLVQFQNDRISLNWRKVGDPNAQPYPRYRRVREMFADVVTRVEAWSVDTLDVPLVYETAELVTIDMIPLVSDGVERRVSEILPLFADLRGRKVGGLQQNWIEPFGPDDSYQVAVVAGMGVASDGLTGGMVQLTGTAPMSAVPSEQGLLVMDALKSKLDELFEFIVPSEFRG